jgi:hypothetical protein
MAIIAKLQQDYEQGNPGIPPGSEWVDTAFSYMDHAGIYDDEAQVRELLDGYQILVPPPPPPPSFAEAMDLPEWWESFKAFTPTEYSGENPDFLDAVRYQSMEPRAIYEMFVADGSERQVNIGSGTRAAIDEAFADGGEPGYDAFAAAMEEVKRMASGDTWRRFLAAPAQ